MTDTMRNVLIQGVERYLKQGLSREEFIQGIILALAESPDNIQKWEDLRWLAAKLTSES